MGCSISKIDTSGVTTLPVKLRPVFLRRLEEIKNRRHSQPLKDSTPSKKELLLHDIDEEDNVSHFSSFEYDTSKNVQLPTKDGTDPSKNESSPTRNSANSVGRFESSKGKDPTKPAGKASKESEAAKCDGNKCNTKDETLAEFSPKMKATNEPKKPETKGDKTKIEGNIANILTDEHGGEDDRGHDKERMISHRDDNVFPGSPSFRIYFTDGMDDDQIDNTRKNDALTDAGLSDDKASLKELPVKKEAKRGRKIQSFRKVLPKGGQSTVMNLLNVTSCYNSSQSARDHAHLLTAKTV
ncbi:uncharacterized protein LOC142551667 isoform X1 [Primulina tabacum]|uniref:uncharacterized protein LOC142551667 isoform X1 n=1 Tax=Primulina tabacum TaxID=48773 RepID=UPI003F5A4A31